MSAHLMIVAGYLDLPLSHKLTLVKMCDSADDRTRLAYPGLDAVRLWAGTRRSRALEVMRELQEWGLVMQVEQGHRGRRATFKVFPDKGDEAFSLAVKRGEGCLGADRFAGPPGIPDDAEIASRIAAMDGDKGSDLPDPSQRVQSPGPFIEGSDSPDPISPNGSSTPDPNEEKGSDSDPRKGPISTPKGSDLPDPFGTKLRNSTPSSSRGSLHSAPSSEAQETLNVPQPSNGFHPADEDGEAARSARGGSDEEPPTADDLEPAAPVRDDVERLCVHLADRIEANGSKRPTITKRWRDAARLMLDRDERTEGQVHRAIDWSQDHHFWQLNILSMPKLRHHYDRLRLQAQAEARPGSGPSNVHRDRPEAVSTSTAGMFA